MPFFPLSISGGGGGGSGVTSVAGTASQVLVNGTSGSAQTGVLALTLPQSIATSSSPAFTALTLTGVLTLSNGTAPTTSAVAQTAFDTNAWAASRGAIQIYDGTANTYVVAALASDTPSNGQVPTWNTGGTVTWETPTGGAAALYVGRSAKTGAYTVVAGDKGYLIDCTANTFTISLTAVATLGDGFFVQVYNSGSGTITVDPAGAENIRESSSLSASKTLAQGEGLVLFCNGAVWYATASVRGWYGLASTDILTTDKVININNSTVSSGIGTGAITTTGGLGVTGAINCAGVLTTTNTTASTSTGSGSGRFSGGVGIVGALYAGVGVSILTTTTLGANRTRGVFTNEGAVARVDITLPTAAAGIQYTFVVNDADGFRITAGTGDTIRIAGSVSASAGYVEATTIGNTITLVSINVTEWIATAVNGTWTVV